MSKPTTIHDTRYNELLLKYNTLAAENARLRQALVEAAYALEVLHNLPIERDENGHAFKRISCRSVTDMGGNLGAAAGAALHALK